VHVTEDGSVVRRDGTVVVFSINRFIRDIVGNECCFICGAASGSKPFNNEHVIPDWILQRHNLYNAKIKLPNRTFFTYGSYKVPCCEECNQEMGLQFETPISQAFQNDYDGVRAFLETPDGLQKVFVWLCLIYIKTHLKDLSLRMHRDLRMSDENIGTIYDWEVLHHVHCVARSFMSGAAIAPEVFGSLLLLRGKSDGEHEFDYGDNFIGRAILLRLGDIALVAVLNDSGASLLFRNDETVLGFRPALTKITKPLSAIQLREVLADLAYTNLRLENRPTFSTVIDPLSELCELRADVPDGLHFGAVNAEFYGELLYSVCRDWIDRIPEPDRTTVIEQCKSGNCSFLFNGAGQQAESDL
jgi:hypothetical protein